MCERAIDELLSAVQRGDRDALEALLCLTYERLHLIAREVIGPRGEHQTLGPSALIHEGFLKIWHGVDWSNIRDAAHFYTLFATCMKQALIDHLRHRNADKRGGGWNRVDLDLLLGATCIPPSQFIDVANALEQLRLAIPRAAEVMEWKHFSGLTNAEIAKLHATSHSTVESDYRLAKAFLRKALFSTRYQSAVSN